MEDINGKEGAELVSLIYGTTLSTDLDILKERRSNKISNLVSIMENDISKLKPNQKLCGEMTKEEFLDVIDQVKDSDTLMRMEIKNFTNNDKNRFPSHDLGRFSKQGKTYNHISWYCR